MDAEGSSAARFHSKANPTPRKFQDKPRWYDYSNKPGHTREMCWKLHGKLAYWKSRRFGDKAGHGMQAGRDNEVAVPFSKEQIEQLHKLLSANQS